LTLQRQATNVLRFLDDEGRDLSSGYTARLQIRSGYADEGGELMLDISEVASFDPETSGIVLEDGGYTIVISYLDSLTIGLPSPRGKRYRYDILLTETATGITERMQ